MRLFWILIGLLTCGTVAVWRVSSKPAAATINADAVATSLAEAARDPAPTNAEPSTPAAKAEPKPDATPAPVIPTPEAKPEAATAGTPDTGPASVANSETRPAAGAGTKAETLPAAPAAETPAAKVTKKDDGTLLIDDRFAVKGSGTAEDPYQLSWELLASASESYDPRVGKKKLPDRLTMFDGKIVRLTGYVAYPMFVEQPRELLSMLNQWDGCCIGVPPTPYDAIEVHLKETVTKDQRLATYGSVEGKFAVKPYLAGDWLVGLYVMENAKVTDTKANGQGS